MTWRDYCWPVFAILCGMVVLTLGLWVLIPRPEEDAPPRRQADVTVFHDTERRVTCWLSPGDGVQQSGAGISCLPDSAFAGAADNGRCQQ